MCLVKRPSQKYRDGFFRFLYLSGPFTGDILIPGFLVDYRLNAILLRGWRVRGRPFVCVFGGGQGLGCPFSKVVCQCQQPHFHIDLIQPAEHEPLETVVVFDVPEYRLHVMAAPLTLFYPPLAFQSFLGLPFQSVQVVVDLYDAISLLLVAPWP